MLTYLFFFSSFNAILEEGLETYYLHISFISGLAEVTLRKKIQ
jgi:hypothetical protein